jgi:hypothetical protein
MFVENRVSLTDTLSGRLTLRDGVVIFIFLAIASDTKWHLWGPFGIGIS